MRTPAMIAVERHRVPEDTFDLILSSSTAGAWTYDSYKRRHIRPYLMGLGQVSLAYTDRSETYDAFQELYARTEVWNTLKAEVPLSEVRARVNFGAWEVDVDGMDIYERELDYGWKEGGAKTVGHRRHRAGVRFPGQ